MKPASPAQADRRVVTVMFADISGFTAMSERMDPEDVTALMNGCFERLSAVIGKYDGTIDKYIGDCIMALFGAPVAMEDAPQRALNAAIEMREDLEQYCRERKLGEPLTLHIGVNTGEVIYGAVGSQNQRQMTAMGDAVNLASRLEDASTSGEILAGPETWRRTSSLFDFEPRGPIQVKGKEERVPVYALRSRKPTVARAGAEPGSGARSAMVGRQRDLERLELQALKAINGEGSIVHVVGEPGIGKSRIVAELRQRIAGRRMTMLEGRAISTGRTLGYHVFDDLLRRWSGIAEDDRPGVALAKLERLVSDLVGGQLEDTFPQIALLTGMKLSGARLERVDTIEPQSLAGIVAVAFRQLLAAASREQALTVVVEDLHWADRSSVELLESLLRLSETAAVVFVLVSRPGYEETSGRVRAFCTEHLPARTVEVPLEPLSEAACSQLVANLARGPEVPRPLRDRILLRAGGNPFFLEEIVRSIYGTGWLGVEGGAAPDPRSAEAIQIPTTVNEVIMSRFDRLGDELKELLRAAAVIGRSFFRTVLEHLAGVGSGMESGIERLKGLEIIRERRRQEEVEYVFVHAIVQETIYGSLLIQKRRELHRQVAEAIEARFADRVAEFYGLLAYHYGRSEDEAKFEQYLSLAGEQALKNAASAEATAFFTQALDLYLRTKGASIDRKRAARLANGIAMSHAARGEYWEAVRQFDVALEFMGVRLSETGPRAVMDAILGFLGLLATLYLPRRPWTKAPSEEDLFVIGIGYYKSRMFMAGEPSKLVITGMSLVKRILRFDLEKLPMAVGYVYEVGGLLAISGFPHLSRRCLEYGDRIVASRGARERYLRSNLGLFLNMVEGDAACTYETEIRKEMIWAGDFTAYQLFLWASCLHEIESGNIGYAEMLNGEGLALGKEHAHRQVFSVAHVNQAYLLLRKGHLQEVIRDVPRFESVLRVAIAEYEIVVLRSYRALAHIQMGDLDEAQRILDADEKLLGDVGYLSPNWVADHALARLCLQTALLERRNASRDRAAAGSLIRGCQKSGRKAVATSRKFTFTRIPTFRAMGTWLWLSGRPRRALAWWGRGIDEGERLGYRLELSRTFFEIGRRLRSAPPRWKTMRGIDSDGWLARAEDLFRVIGLDRDLAMLEEMRRA